MAADNLFYMVMEADGDDALQPFDAGGLDDSPDASNDAPPTDTGSNDPPPLEDSGVDALSFPGDDGGGDTEDSTGDNADDDSGDGENGEDEQLSEKANNVLNQRLYQTMLARNTEIEEIVENLQKLTPMLPYEVVKENDEALNQLKSALSAGQSYAIEKFLDAKYGENLLYYKKLDALYVLLEDKINSNLKKVQKEGSSD